MNQAQHRTKNLGVREFTLHWNVVEHGGLHEISLFSARDFRASAIEDNFSAIAFAKFHQRLDSGFALRRDHRSHLNAVVQSVADAQGSCRFEDRVTEHFLCFAHGDRYRNRKTTLSGASESAVANDLRRHLHIGVRKNDHVILRAALALGALAVGSGAGIDVFRNRS